jgi:hypothetical protein
MSQRFPSKLAPILVLASITTYIGRRKGIWLSWIHFFRRSRIYTCNDEIRNNKYVESIRNTIAQIRNSNENSEYPIKYLLSLSSSRFTYFLSVCQFGDDIYLSTFLSLSLKDQHLCFEQVETRSFYRYFFFYLIGFPSYEIREISTELINKKNTSSSVKVSQELAGEYHLIIAGIIS